jgi:hypothetical protein
MSDVRGAVDRTLAALHSAERPADAALIELAQRYADGIDLEADGLARYGPSLRMVLKTLFDLAEPTIIKMPDNVTEDELTAFRQRRAGSA